MENNPKKSKALITTIIIIVLLLIVGYLIYKNRDVFGVKTSNTIAKIFSPLVSSTNSKNLSRIDENSQRTSAQAGEDLKAGDNVSVFGTGSNNYPIIMRSGRNDSVYGFTSQDIKNGDVGEVIIKSGGANTFWNSFSGFLGDVFNKKTLPPSGGWTYDSNTNQWTFDPNGKGGWIFDSNTWVPPGGITTVPPSGGWTYDSNTNQWTFDPNGKGGWIFDSNTNTWVPPTTTQTEEGIPELRAGAVTPTSTTINTPVILSSTITNSGGSGTSHSFSSFFSITKTIDNKNVELKTTVPALRARTEVATTVSYSFSKAGTYSIRVCADKSSASDIGTVAEINENNNCGSPITFTVTNSLPPPGDLPQCSDGIDNDKDGKIDIADPNCHLEGNLNKDYVSTHNSETNSPTPSDILPRCSDKIDNDKDGKIDAADPNCHIDGDLNKQYVPTHDSETNSPVTPNVNKCLLIEQNPLTFTPEEKARLAILLRKFYLISSTLKTGEDITTIYNEIDQQKNFINQIEELTKQCIAQVDGKNLMSKGFGWVRHGNPWYSETSGGTFPYTNESTGYVKLDQLEGKTTKDKCKVVSGYYYGTSTFNWQDCSSLNTFSGYGDCTKVSAPNIDDLNKSGCKWKEGVLLEDTERILNIW